jgi:DNA-binding transcriptional ArsR family regulator
MVKSTEAKLDTIFNALSDSTRRMILNDIAFKDKTVGEIAKPYKMSLAAVSKHLKVLANANLIERRKEGSFQVVSLNAKTFKTAEKWLSFYKQFWDVRLDNLQKILEENEK